MTLFESQSKDHTYIELRDITEFAQQRAFAEALFKRFEPYADKEFISEFSRHCISRYWEMYLGCALLDGGFNLVPRGDLPRGGPDFCIRQNGSRIWIEAVTISSGEGQDRIIPIKDQPTDRFHLVPSDKIVLRFCSEIRDKHLNHLRHLSDGLVSANEPFIIAVNGSGIPRGYWEADGIPYAIQAVLPFGHYSITVDTRTKKIVQEGFEHRKYIVKLNIAEGGIQCKSKPMVSR